VNKRSADLTLFLTPKWRSENSWKHRSVVKKLLCPLSFKLNYLTCCHLPLSPSSKVIRTYSIFEIINTKSLSYWSRFKLMRNIKITFVKKVCFQSESWTPESCFLKEVFRHRNAFTLFGNVRFVDWSPGFPEESVTGHVSNGATI
jgi:hypothetical protein